MYTFEWAQDDYKNWTVTVSRKIGPHIFAHEVVVMGHKEDGPTVEECSQAEQTAMTLVKNRIIESGGQI